MARENEQGRTEMQSAAHGSMSGRAAGSRSAAMSRRASVSRSATVSREDIRRIVAKLKEEDTKE